VVLWRLAVLFFCCEAVLAVRFNPGVLYGGVLLALLTLKHYLLFQLQLPTASAYVTLLYSGFTTVCLTLMWRIVVARGPLAGLLARVAFTPGWHRGYKVLRVIGITEKWTLLLVEPAAMAAFVIYAAMMPVTLHFRPFWHYLGGSGHPLPPLPDVAWPAWWPDAAPWISLILPCLSVMTLIFHNRAEFTMTREGMAQARQQQQRAEQGAVAPSGPVLQFPMMEGPR
jgi:hypothetical protein